MGFRTGLALATAATLIVGVLVFRGFQSETLVETEALQKDAPAPTALRPEAETSWDPTDLPEPAARAEVRSFDLSGDELEAALPELVELARGGDDAAFQAILRGIEDPGNQARERSVLALGRVGDGSIVVRFEPLLRDPDPDVREGLVKTLVKLGGPEAKALLVDLVLDPDPDVAEDAIQALVSAGYEPGIPAIREVLARGAPQLYAKAASALRQLGDQASASAALAQVAKGLDSPSAIERRDTVAQIRIIGGTEAMAYLDRAIEDPDLSVRSDAARAIAAVAEALEE